MRKVGLNKKFESKYACPKIDNHSTPADAIFAYVLNYGHQIKTVYLLNTEKLLDESHSTAVDKKTDEGFQKIVIVASYWKETKVLIPWK